MRGDKNQRKEAAVNDSTAAYRLREQLKRFVGIIFPHVPKLQKEFLGQMFFGMLHWNGKRLAEDLAGEIKNASGDVLFSCAYELGHAGHMTIAVGR